MLKMLGTGFGINTAIHGIDILYLIAGRPKGLTNTLFTLQNYMRYPVEPIYEVVNKLTRPITKPVVNKLNTALREQAIDETTHALAWATTISIKPLLSTSIAYYLFKKANSYQETIEKLKAEIAIDEQMLKALPNVPAQQ